MDNFTQLVEMYEKYKDKGLQILGFPCPQFMGQEFGTEKEIRNYLDQKFIVNYPMFSKIEINGVNTHPVYRYLKSNSKQMRDGKGIKNVPWNYGKFLVDFEGRVIKFYGPTVKPSKILQDIELVLRGETDWDKFIDESYYSV